MPGGSTPHGDVGDVLVWRIVAFQKLWSAQTLALFGNQITALAIPLLAVERLAATPFQMGLPVMAASLPVPVVGLVAGVWVDRRRWRPIVIAADQGHAALLSLIPLAAVTNHLAIAVLAALVFLIGILKCLS